MEFKVNMNESVKVKLTTLGVSILQEKHDKLNEHIKENGGIPYEEFSVTLDEEGYYKTQLWSLMNTFGKYMYAGLGQPFETDVIIENGNPVVEAE